MSKPKLFNTTLISKIASDGARSISSLDRDDQAVFFRVFDKVGRATGRHDSVRLDPEDVYVVLSYCTGDIFSIPIATYGVELYDVYRMLGHFKHIPAEKLRATPRVAPPEHRGDAAGDTDRCYATLRGIGGRKIDVIKVWRRYTLAELKVAKEMVESCPVRLPPPTNGSTLDDFVKELRGVGAEVFVHC